MIGRSLRIAMIGQRGVPATSGGVERHVEELGARLVAAGHHVTVYSRPSYVDAGLTEHRGMEVRSVKTRSTKHFDAIVHSALSTLVAQRNGFDIVHYHALGPGLVSPLPRFTSRAKVVQTVHGLDGERAKWGGLAQKVLGAGTWLSAKVPDATIVVASNLVGHYAETYGARVHHIPNGVIAPTSLAADEIRTRWGLEPGSYFLYVGRLVPEKGGDILIEAFRDVPGDARLIFAGGSSFSDDFVSRLETLATADERVLLPGPIHGTTLAELYSNAAAFVTPSLLEGLPLTLLEAGTTGRPVIASDIAPHGEVLDEPGPGVRLVPVGDRTALAEAMTEVFGNDAAVADAARLPASVAARYDWDSVTERTIELYRSVLSA